MRFLRFLRRRWKRVLAVIVVVYLVLISGRFGDWVVIGPRPGHFDAGIARRQWVTVNGRRVEVWVAHSAALADGAQPQGYVLEFCGNSTRAEQIASFVPARWKNFPVETWVMNYPGAGGSEGWLSLRSIPPAALGVFDELHHRAGDKPIFLEANSLGTTAALCVAARRHVAGCVLQDPPPLRQLILHKYGWWNLWLLAGPVALQVPHELDSIENARHVTAPCIFILAGKDTLVLPKFRKLVIDAYAGKSRTVLMPGKGHWDSVDGQAEADVEKDLEWLWEERSVENN